MKKVIAILCCGMIALGAVSRLPAVAGKKWTVTERQVELRKKVANGQKNNELTLKESEKLTSRLDKIAADIEKYKSKNGGKLSYKDEGKIEKRLNSISVDLQKCELNKRTVGK
jgi:hypothetical protein